MLITFPCSGSLPFGNLRLKYLKELKLCGYNFARRSDIFHLCLSDMYINTLKAVMNSIGRPNLQSLEILSDSTEQMDFLTAMLPGFVNLRRVVLHNSTPESSKQPQKPNLALLYCLMACTSVEHIVMKGFEYRCDREQPLQLALVSPSVRVLDLDFGKWYKSFCSIVSLDMPRLERLSFAGTNSSCLDHLMQGKLKVKLAKGAPALRYFNNVGKFALKKKVGCMLWL